MLGIVVALPGELKTLTSKKLDVGSWQALSHDVLVVRSGMGPDRAYYAGALLADRGAKVLCSWGCASALDSSLRAGSLVLPERVMAANGEIYLADPGLHRRLCRDLSGAFPQSTGPLVESAQILQTPGQKQMLARRTLAFATDMESAAEARLARDRGLRFIAIRAVADSVSTCIPEPVVESLDGNGHIRPFKFFAGVALRPAVWPKILRLAAEFSAARKTLKRAARMVLNEDLLTGLPCLAPRRGSPPQTDS